LFNKILIANRGEIAVRIIRACKEMGISTVAVYSTADRSALHTQLADESVCIGPPKASSSYLNMQNIISATLKTKAEAIHPGFGFLSENSIFASMCNECNIKFIGPDYQTIELMGNKTNAKALMNEAGVPLIPGSDGVVKTLSDAFEVANILKYPIIIKAVSGGGGKGIRIVRSESELESNFLGAKSEAREAFGDDRVYIEKLIENAKHIEVQVLADEYGNIIHLGERDCSLQQRNQKIIEEAPSKVINDEKRDLLGELSIKAARLASYKNAGTIEYLYDINGDFYFMEMNTRIQVEHPITEMVTGIDIVKEQIAIAYGKKLTLTQEDVNINGHSIEFRINTKTAGKIDYLFLPSGGLGLRVDSCIYAGYTVPPYYDSMLAKIIVKADSRKKAILKMKRAMDEIVISGVETNIEFLIDILNNENYLAGDFNTKFIDDLNLNSVKKD
jgi:acetyl-CoA carboxylase, biotin carboxylase subunit